MTHNELRETIQQLRDEQHIKINDRTEPLKVVSADPTGTVTVVTLEGHNTTYTLTDGLNSPVSENPVGTPNLRSSGGGVDEDVTEIELVEVDEDGGDDDDG